MAFAGATATSIPAEPPLLLPDGLFDNMYDALSLDQTSLGDLSCDGLSDQGVLTRTAPGSLAGWHRPLLPAQDRMASPPRQAASSSRPRHERKGHTKSRRGCFNCKKRRIKCQEVMPACGHCVKAGLHCEYPAVPQIRHQPLNQCPIFSMQDMRFFHHFLQNCTPHHPINNEKVWIHEIPQLCMTNEFLMHAVLGFAASDLMNSEPGLREPAMEHRLKAIRAIKKLIADPKSSASYEEGNALIATSYALTFQSVVLSDGIVEYMTFVRGIMIIGIQMFCKGTKYLFENTMSSDQTEALKPFIEPLPLIDREWVDASMESLKALEELMRDEPLHIKYHEMITTMANNLYDNGLKAYEAMTAHYAWWMMLPHDEFLKVVDLSNQACVLLATHWIALKMIMATITDAERLAGAVNRPKPMNAASNRSRDSEETDTDTEKAPAPEAGMFQWLTWLNSQVNETLAAYNAWPASVEKNLHDDYNFFRKLRAHEERHHTQDLSTSAQKHAVRPD